MMEVTEPIPPEGAKKGTNAALLGGLLFLTLLFAFVVITVVVIFFCYCRKAKGERYKYHGQSLEEGRRRQRMAKNQNQNNKRTQNPLDNFVTTREHSPGVSTTGMLSVEALRRVAARYDNDTTAPNLHGVHYDTSYLNHFASRIQNGTRVDNGTRLERVAKEKPETCRDVTDDNRKTSKRTEYKHAVDDNREKTAASNREDITRGYKLDADKVYTPPELRKLPRVPGDKPHTTDLSTDLRDNVTSSDDKTDTSDAELFLRKWQRENDIRRRQPREELEDDLIYDSNIVYESTDVDPDQSTDRLSEVNQPETAELNEKHDKTDYHNVSERSRLPEVEALNELDKAVEGHLDGLQPISVQELNTRRNNRLPPLEGSKLPPIGGSRAKLAGTSAIDRCNDDDSDDVSNKVPPHARRHSVSGACHDGDDMTSSLRGHVGSLSEIRKGERSSSFRHSRRRSTELPDARAAHRRSLSSDRATRQEGKRTEYGQVRDGSGAEYRCAEERGRARNGTETRSEDAKNGRRSSKTRSRQSSKTRSGHGERAGYEDDADAGGVGDGDKPSSGDELRHRLNDNRERDRHRSDHHHHGDEPQRNHHHHHHRHHHSRERGHHRNKSNEEQLDDLAMTLHAEDELYQLHKRAPAVDLCMESEQEYSV